MPISTCSTRVQTPPPNFGGGGGVARNPQPKVGFRPQPAGQNDFSPANFAGETHFARIPRAAGSWDAGEMREKFCGSPAAAGKKFSKKKFFSPATSLNFWRCLYTCGPPLRNFDLPTALSARIKFQ